MNLHTYSIKIEESEYSYLTDIPVLYKENLEKNTGKLDKVVMVRYSDGSREEFFDVVFKNGEMVRVKFDQLKFEPSFTEAERILFKND